MLYAPSLFEETIDDINSFKLNLDPERTANWLSALEASIDNYPELRREKFSRLGLYCEALMAFCFTVGWKEKVIPFRLREKNLQINGHKNTIGECDFIVEDHRENTIHLELAVKFYLQAQENQTRWSNWIGPNAVDRLDLKMRRMFSHQLRLLMEPEHAEFVEPVLNDLGLRQPIEARYFVKGYLFFRFTQGQHKTLAERANTNLLRGYWLHLDDFKNYNEASRNADITICEKLDWLTGPMHKGESMVSKDVMVHIENIYRKAEESNRKTPPIYLLVSDRKEGLRSHPFVVVPNHWPETNSPSRII